MKREQNSIVMWDPQYLNANAVHWRLLRRLERLLFILFFIFFYWITGISLLNSDGSHLLRLK